MFCAIEHLNSVLFFFCIMYYSFVEILCDGDFTLLVFAFSYCCLLCLSCLLIALSSSSSLFSCFLLSKRRAHMSCDCDSLSVFKKMVQKLVMLLFS